MTLVYTVASDRKVIRTALTNNNNKVAPSSKVRDSSDQTRIKRLIAKTQAMRSNSQ